ncbi:MAG: DNA-binding protein WhiA, partial [Oscillospiraceae bacterium]|nr:DNA-binding protein WhiA [Oscillospiraceae bacterium]
MSFTADIKNELCESIIPQSLIDTFSYGLLYPLGEDRPYITTDSKNVEHCFLELFSKHSASEQKKRNDSVIHKITLDTDKLNEKFGLYFCGINRSFVSGNDVDTGVFLRGVFISCGSLSVQKAGYHMELSVRNSDKCEQLYNLIREQGMKINRSVRRGIPYLYSKDSENIADFLAFIGAMQSSMEIMNIKIYKDFRSNINRKVNCEAANIGKTVAASARQIEDISFISECGEYDKLPIDLKELASLRVENPDISLSELGKLFDPPISRSGVNHRIERIRKIADELRESRK